MRVFLTGATGWIGSAIVPELLESGHDVLGLARSDESVAALEAAGAVPHHGSLEDLDSLRDGALAADAVIHTAYIHDFSQMENAARADLRAIETFGDALEGSGRPLIVTGGTALLKPGEVATEEDFGDPASGAHPRTANEHAALALAERGVRVSSIRCAPSVHGEGDHGFVPILIDIARTKGVSAYVGDGANRWPAVHRLDAASLYRLVLERGTAGTAYHAVGEEGVPTRAIAEVIGRHLDIPVVSIAPEDAADHLGWMGLFFSVDVPASSHLTRQWVGFNPTHLKLIEDLDAGYYFGEVAAVS